MLEYDDSWLAHIDIIVDKKLRTLQSDESYVFLIELCKLSIDLPSTARQRAVSTARLFMYAGVSSDILKTGIKHYRSQ